MVDDPAIIVRDVFKSIFGGRLDGCDKTLENVLFSKDFDVPVWGFVCPNPRDIAMTIYLDTTNPTIILCPTAMLHGIIGQGSVLPKLPDFPLPVTCNTLGDTTSWRMNTLGSTILHEWTHIVPLVGQALASTHRPIDSTVDTLNGNSVYGCVQTQAIADNEEAFYIADSYVWFAMEAFWSKKCGKTFGKPGPGDGNDPKYDNTPGTEAHPVSGP
jgi:hypothetical protein